ncbi:hypothetical protein [Actinocorallia longicatena]|uniref:DUF3592 domain-containing protein n=1 Tax=Actinocorallia longicatena TaxID=111803 RepID=A0ABP6QNC9_9ACTN
MARSNSDGGSLSGVTTLSFLVLVGCLVFLTGDFKHRAEGYQAVTNGKGVAGSVTVTRCGSGLLDGHCEGTFTSADGSVVRTGVRINGADAAGVVRDAVMSPGGSVWTASGHPWMRPSIALLISLAPFATGWMILVAFFRGGLPGIRSRRLLGDQKRSAAQERATRMGRVY